MLCRKLGAHLPEAIDSVYLGNPTLSADDMLAAILADLGIDAPEAGRQARLTQLNAILLERHQAGRRVVVFIEEAQGIALDNLEFLRLLTNLETATDKLLQIVLFGQPELDEHLAEPRIRQLKDRITLSLNLSPLTHDEVAAYLRARLAVAGYRGPDLFPAALTARITRMSGGLSRRINVLADKMLLAAYAGQTHTLTAAHLHAAADDAELQPARGGRAASQRWLWLWLGAGLAAVLGLLAFIAWQMLTLTAPTVATPTAPPAAAPAAAPDMTELARQTRQWLASAPPATRVIQLASAKEASAAAVLLGSLSAAAPQPVRVLHGLSQGEAAWMILAGEFPDRDAAMAALRRLPAVSGKGSPLQAAPFLRTVGKMRSLVLPTG
jgi:type II secretory pathway predicted ATPase ExeA